LSKILERCSGQEVIGKGGDGRDALRQAELLHAGVAILDIGIPLMNDIEATADRPPMADIRTLIPNIH
jgi:DNA-binding NarL/FixJ family response regulator